MVCHSIPARSAIDWRRLLAEDTLQAPTPRPRVPVTAAHTLPTGTPEVMIIDDQDDQIINAEVVDSEDQDIVFLD